jgi:hypothetical protein
MSPRDLLPRSLVCSSSYICTGTPAMVSGKFESESKKITLVDRHFLNYLPNISMPLDLYQILVNGVGE